MVVILFLSLAVCSSQAFDGRRRVTKTMPSHGADVLSKLRSQREAGLFCDITLQTNGQSFSAHRAVLAAVSDHFQELFNEMDLSKKADIDLTGKSKVNVTCMVLKVNLFKLVITLYILLVQ
uniref:BTB domain-containing protein n=1 Tax=Nothobranchius furzeri TaxID=105023 RepID=A0A8C6L5M5_NOTFU